MSESTISIKIANGSFYPVLEKGFTGRKKLTVTTVRDNQEKVQIDLYRGNGGSLEQPSYVGSLIVENIPPAPQGEPEIELFLGIDPSGELSAEASDKRTGESQKFSTTLTRLSEGDLTELPEFEVEEEESGDRKEEEQSADLKEESASPARNPGTDFEERPLTGESYRVTQADRRREAVDRGERRGLPLWLLILFVLVGILVVGAIAYYVYQRVSTAEAAGQAAPPATTTPQTPGPAQTPAQTTPGSGQQPATTGSGEGQTGEQAQVGSGGQASVKTSAGKAATVAKGGVTYRIKRGDTLWDISATYYRNPWLYHKLARANSIRNPDLIFAGSRLYIPEN